MDSITDIVDEIVDNLAAAKIIKREDKTNAFLAIEDSIKTMMEDFNIKIVFDDKS